jgi:hypothetical protein
VVYADRKPLDHEDIKLKYYATEVNEVGELDDWGLDFYLE